MDKEKPNAFAFKARIDEEYKICICPRVDEKWSENDIFYLSEPNENFYKSLEDELFHVVFLNYKQTEEGGVWIDPGPNPFYMKHPEKTSQQLYAEGQFFSTIEHIYKEVYEKESADETTNPEQSDESDTEQSSGEGVQTETDK